MKLALGLGINQRAENLESMSGFSIDGLSGLVAWYPFNTGQTVDSGALAEWIDASGNGHKLTNTSETNKRPTYESGRINFGNVTNSFMDIGGTVVPNTAPHTIFLCVELSISSSTEFSTFLAGSNTQNGAHGFTFGTLSGQTNQLWQWIVDNTTGDNDFTSVSGTGQLQNDTKTIIQLVYGGGTAAGDSTCVISTDANGGSLTQCVSQTEANADADTYQLAAVGLNHSGFFPKGYIDEIVIFNRKLSVSECSDVRADIKARNSMT